MDAQHADRRRVIHGAAEAAVAAAVQPYGRYLGRTVELA